VEAELADGAPVWNASKQVIKKIAKAPLPGFVDVDGAAARANIFIPHAEVDEIEAANHLKQDSQHQEANRDLVSNPHPGIPAKDAAFLVWVPV
jgi:hypothetical protein